MSAMAPSLYVPTVRGEVEVFRVILEIVLLEEASQLLPAGELDPARAVDVHVPPASLLTVLPLLQLTDPPVGQRVVRELQNFGQMGWSPAYLHVAMRGGFTVTRQGEWSAGDGRPKPWVEGGTRPHAMEAARRQGHPLVLVPQVVRAHAVARHVVHVGGHRRHRRGVVGDVDQRSPRVVVV